MRRQTIQLLLAASAVLLLSMASGCGSSQQETKKGGTKGGANDDEPIIIGDTQSLPTELQKVKTFTPPLRFIWGPELKPIILQAGAPQVAAHNQFYVHSAFVCSRPDNTKPYAIQDSDDFGPKEFGSVVVGDLNDHGGGNAVMVRWRPDPVVRVDGHPNPFASAHGEALDFGITRVIWSTAGKPDYVRAAPGDDVRLVLHYCSTGCSVSDFSGHVDMACQEGHPNTTDFPDTEAAPGDKK